MSEPLIPVFETRDILKHVLHRQLLEEAEIPVMESGIELFLNHWVITAVMAGQPGCRLFVFARDADQADVLIADYQQGVTSGEYRLSDDEEETCNQEEEEPSAIWRIIFAIVIILMLAFRSFGPLIMALRGFLRHPFLR